MQSSTTKKTNMQFATLSSKGQITIPKRIRDRLKLSTGDQVIFVDDGERIIIDNPNDLTFIKIKDTCEEE